MQNQQQPQQPQHPQQPQGESSFSKGMKITFGVVFALFLLFVVAPCAMCGGCGVFSAALQEAEADRSSSTEPSGPDLEFAEIDTRVTEQNRVWWKYAWKVSVKNLTDRPQSIDLKIKWIDADGFEVDSTREYNLRVPASQEETFDGAEMIQLPSAKQIDGIEVEEI
jgi:hypothetical protein